MSDSAGHLHQNGYQPDDTFVTSVPWDDRRTVLVYHRVHAGREYIRLRTWNKHRKMGFWYPSPRRFIIPFRNAEALGEAILTAAHGGVSEKPEWLKGREAARSEH